MIGNFNEEAQTVLINAKEEMLKLGHPYIGTEHLLLAIVSDSDDEMQALCKEFNLHQNKIQSVIKSERKQNVNSDNPVLQRYATSLNNKFRFNKNKRITLNNNSSNNSSNSVSIPWLTGNMRTIYGL